MVTRYYCDCCKKEVESSSDLKKDSISIILTDNQCDDPHRTIASLHFDLCRRCLLENEPMLRKQIEELPSFLSDKETMEK
jgi:hypothetical protein